MSTESTEAEAPPPTFDILPLSVELRRAIDELGYTHPTPVQRAVFEPAVRGGDLVVQAQTGTGKTASFAMPLVDSLVKRSSNVVQALVLCPTRELALQVNRELEALGKYRNISCTAVYGGAPMPRQVEAIQGGAQVVVGTPGRVLDHLRRGTLDASGIRTFILDESDEMLSMGFLPQITEILGFMPKTLQTLLFSATLPPDIRRYAERHLKNQQFLTLSGDHICALSIEHTIYLSRGDKLGELMQVIEVENPESAIIFCNTRDETKRVAEALQQQGFAAGWLNADLAQNDREKVMAATRNSEVRFLVCTDVAARGIDISHLTHVINYDFPESAENYVHRTARTGRAGRTGTAISIIGPKDIGNLYLLRLTYRIRPIEKQLPSAGELKTRAEMDVLQLFVDAFASRPAHPDDLSLARRLLNHDEAERILAGLLRDHLGARGGDAVAEAGEARRARNPPPEPVQRSVAREERVRQRVEAPQAVDAASAAEPPRRDPRPRDRDAREPRGRERERPREAHRERALATPLGTPLATPAAASPAAPAPVASFTRWQPPREPDDDRPILDDGPSRESSRLPGVTISDAVVKSPAAEPHVAVRSPADTRDRDDDFSQLFVNVGKRDGVNPADLQKLLLDAGIAVDPAQAIRMRDRMSFVRVSKENFDGAVAALSGHVLGGRTVVAELARGSRS